MSSLHVYVSYIHAYGFTRLVYTSILYYISTNVHYLEQNQLYAIGHDLPD